MIHKDILWWTIIIIKILTTFTHSSQFLPFPYSLRFSKRVVWISTALETAKYRLIIPNLKIWSRIWCKIWNFEYPHDTLNEKFHSWLHRAGFSQNVDTQKLYEITFTYMYEAHMWFRSVLYLDLPHSPNVLLFIC